jgi:hypothetical protein
MLGLGILAGAAYAVWRAMESRRQPSGITWEPRPFPYPPEPRLEPVPEVADTPDLAEAVPAAPPGPAAANGTTWVDAADGECPVTHPVKAKLASGIYHVPGGANYTRTQADRCYGSAEAAESDGLRPAKR